MKIAIGSDHAGYGLKLTIKKYLVDNGYQVLDVGCDSIESCDYPVYGIRVGEKVANKEVDRGIVICGSGIGISIAANKVNGVRCALVHDQSIAKISRQHNDANVLALPGRFMTPIKAQKIVNVWINTAFDGGRHEKRVNIIKDYEESRK